VFLPFNVRLVNDGSPVLGSIMNILSPSVLSTVLGDTDAYVLAWSKSANQYQACMSENSGAAETEMQQLTIENLSMKKSSFDISPHM